MNGDSLEGMDLNEAVSKIKGPKGTKARLEVSRPGQSEVLKIVVVRDEIPIETVHADMLDGKIGKLEISQFSTDTSKDFLKELEELESKGMKGLVIDVRGNPGGLLPAVVEISEQLVPDQKKIMMTEDKTGHRIEYKSKMKEKRVSDRDSDGLG